MKTIFFLLLILSKVNDLTARTIECILFTKRIFIYSTDNLIVVGVVDTMFWFWNDVKNTQELFLKNMRHKSFFFQNTQMKKVKIYSKEKQSSPKILSFRIVLNSTLTLRLLNINTVDIKKFTIKTINTTTKYFLKNVYMLLEFHKGNQNYFYSYSSFLYKLSYF